MRRVVTGEQVAQIYNPDPFARPVLRAPVYQTPAGLILIAWLIRGLARLVRLIIRHPVAATVLGLLAFMWVRIGWIGPAVMVGLGRARAGDLAVLLAALRSPGGWRRPHGVSGGPGSTGAAGLP